MIMAPRRIRLVALLSLFVLVAARCGANPQTVEVTRVVVETTTEESGPAVVTRIVHRLRQIVATPTPSPEPGSKTFVAPDPSRLVITAPGEPATLDPALAGDVLSMAVLHDILESLIAYDPIDPTRFVPVLATEVPSEENGLISADGTTFTFPIREGVSFHDGSPLEPHDVAYSIRRGLLQSDPGSPQWMFIESILGYVGGDITEQISGGAFAGDPVGLASAPPAELLATCEAVMAAVTFDDDAGTVTIHLARPYSSFLSVIANLLLITDQEWAVANGAWDSDCATWQRHYAPGVERSTLSPIANGTGPFQLENWMPGRQFVLVANPAYWRTDDTPLFPGGPSGVAAIPRIILNVSDIEWSTALLQTLRGDSDLVAFLPEDQGVVQKEIGEFCDYKTGECVPNPDEPDGLLRKWDSLPNFARTDLFMNFNISPASAYIGSGKLDGEGIPPDFFSDVDVRKAMATCFDYDTYLNDVLLEGGIRNNGPIITGMLGYNEDGPLYDHDPEACARHLEQAWGGVLPEIGFRFSLIYVSGNDQTANTIGAILQEQLAAINEKYRLELVGLALPSYLGAAQANQAPMFVGGWVEDFHDPHNWAQPYTIGIFAGRQNMPEELRGRFGELIEAGIATTDPAAREQAYFALQQLYYDTAPAVILGQASNYRIEPRYIEGWYFDMASFTPMYALSLRSR